MSLRTETTLPPGRHDEKNEIKLAYYLLFFSNREIYHQEKFIRGVDLWKMSCLSVARGHRSVHTEERSEMFRFIAWAAWYCRRQSKSGH
jgi:hypothetical protein